LLPLLPLILQYHGSPSNRTYGHQLFQCKVTHDQCILPSKGSDIILCHKNKDSIHQLHNERISNFLHKFLSSLFYLLSLALPDLSTTAYLPWPSLRYTLLPMISLIHDICDNLCRRVRSLSTDICGRTRNSMIYNNQPQCVAIDAKSTTLTYREHDTCGACVKRVYSFISVGRTASYYVKLSGPCVFSQHIYVVY
jgi:hypothetical protein